MNKTILIFILYTFVATGYCKLLKNKNSEVAEDPQEFLGPLPKFDVYDDRKNNVMDINIRFYNGNTTNEYVDIKLVESMKLLQEPTFDRYKPIVFYIHGYIENPEKVSVLTVVNAYLTAKPGTNVILVDWSNMAYGSYVFNAAPNTHKVAETLAKEMKKLLDEGMNFESLHIVGHSLGGQIAGFTGKNLISLGIQLKRISGLDPAFPLFYPGLVLHHISKDDADFVDIIHTDAGAYGAPVNTGTVDFWPNGGTKYQPGCPRGISPPLSPNNLCSHWRSWQFWAESVMNPKAFPSLKADSFMSYLMKVNDGSLKNSSVVYMGIEADIHSTGDYYLTTNPSPPFGKGQIE